MKYKLFLLLFILGRAEFVGAQFYDGFESWITQSTPFPFNWMYPEGWSTSNPITELSEFSVLPSSVAHSGSFAVEIKSVPVFNQYKPGILLLGEALYNYVTLEMKGTSGIQLVHYPYRLSGWYNLAVGDSTHRAVVEVAIKRLMGHESDSILYSARLELSPVSTYTYFTIDLEHDFILDMDRDRLIVLFQSAMDNNSSTSATLHLDDIEVEFTSKINDTNLSGVNILQIRPNLVSRGQSILLDFDSPLEEDLRVNIFNYSGTLIKEYVCSQFSTQLSIETNDLDPGKYLLQSERGKMVSSFVVQ